MKFFWKLATMLTLVAGCVCVSTGMARAQVVSRGMFRLPNAVRWGKHTLPKGNYHYMILETGIKEATVTVIRAASSSRRFQMVGLGRTPDVSTKGSRNSVLVTRGANGNSLRGIYLASSGVEYVFGDYGRSAAAVAGNPKTQPVCEDSSGSSARVEF